MPPEGFVWPAPWAPIASEDACLEYPRLLVETFGEQEPADSLARELQREVGSLHPLYRVACRAIGRNLEDPNEFLFSDRAPADASSIRSPDVEHREATGVPLGAGV
jgi:hypothetical protein